MTTHDQATRRTRRLLLALATALVALAAAGNASAAPFVPKGLLDGARLNPLQRVNVIVVADPGTSSEQLERDLKRSVLTLGGRRGPLVNVRAKYDVVPALALELPAGLILPLSLHPHIHSITPDGPVAQQAAFTPLELWPSVVRADELWPEGAKDRPRPPAIAIVDSGIDASLPDFERRIAARVNTSSFSPGTTAADGFGHGTMVASIAAGASSSYPGVAPTAKIIALRAVDAEGRSRIADVLAAADWIYKHRVARGIGVVNFSIRSTHPNWGFYDPINLAVERLWHTGTVVVASAGNGGAERMLFAPASDPFVITVGATDTAGTVGHADDFDAPWSSRGYTAEGFAKPELAAPGRRIVAAVPADSTLARMFPERAVAPGYMWMSGTSFSAPMVSGAAAQLLARHPDWSPDQVKGALMLTARTLSGAAPLSTGVGEIDIAAAAALASPPNPNENLYDFVRHDDDGRPYFDAPAWHDHVEADASWTSASWTSASWTSASWTSASWTSASWTSSAHADASWTSASWTSASWTSASWTSASWTSASWTSASWTSALEHE